MTEHSQEREALKARRQMDTQHELTDSVTSQAMLARPGLGGLMRDDNGQSHSNQGAAAQRLSGSNSSHLGMSEETRSGMNGDGDDQEMLALPESAPRDLQLGFREARGVAEVGGVTKERCLEDLMRNDFRCKFTDGSLPCEESASEFMPFQGSLKGIEIGPGYYCIGHALSLFQARRGNLLRGRQLSEAEASDLMLRAGSSANLVMRGRAAANSAAMHQQQSEEMQESLHRTTQLQLTLREEAQAYAVHRDQREASLRAEAGEAITRELDQQRLRFTTEMRDMARGLESREAQLRPGGSSLQRRCHCE
jgi:hypothetical protein